MGAPACMDWGSAGAIVGVWAPVKSVVMKAGTASRATLQTRRIVLWKLIGIRFN